MNKKFTSVIVSIVLAIFVFSLIGCGNTDYEKKIAQLEDKINSQDSNISTLESQVDEQSITIRQLNSKIEILTAKASGLLEQLDVKQAQLDYANANLLKVEKELIKVQLELYAYQKSVDYSAYSKKQVMDIVSESIELIDAAEDKAAAQQILQEKKASIDAITNKQIKLYTINDAYENGLVAREDVMHIIYFMQGEVYTIDEITGDITQVDFTPQVSQPSDFEVTNEIKEDMCKAYYYKNKNLLDGILEELHSMGSCMSYETPLSTIMIEFYFGKYNNVYAVDMYTLLEEEYVTNVSYQVADIVWEGTSNPIYIFMYE